MAKKTKARNFFQDANLSLKREKEKARKNMKDDRGKHPGNKGFIDELHRQNDVSPEYHRAKRVSGEEDIFKGQDVAPRKAEQTIDLNVDPSKVESDSPDKGFSEQLNNRLDWAGVKK